MNKSSELKLSIILLFSSIIVALLCMSTLSSMKLGLGFGKDARVVIETEFVEDLKEFSRTLNLEQYESKLQSTEGNIHLLDVSGIESASSLSERIYKSVPNSNILLIGTFGSMTKFLNNQSFVSLSIFALLVITFIYYVFRYRSAGWYIALDLISISMGSLGIVMAFGFSFSKVLWLVYLLAFAILFLAKDYALKNDKIYFPIAFVGIVLSIVIYRFAAFDLANVALYLLSFSLLILSSRIVYCFIFKGLIENVSFKLDKSLEDLFEIKSERNSVLFKIFGITLSIIILLTVGGISRLTQSNPQQDLQQANILVVEISDSASYLEVQALFNRINLFDRQVDYRVSEQGDTWIQFDQTLHPLYLELASQELKSSLDINSFYYSTQKADSILLNTYLSNIILFIALISFTFVVLIKSNPYFFILFLSFGLSLVLYIFGSNILGFGSSDFWLISFLFLPLVIAIISLRIELETINKSILESIILSSLILFLISLPILTIVPTRTSTDILFTILALLIISYASIFVAFNIYKKGNDLYNEL